MRVSTLVILPLSFLSIILVSCQSNRITVTGMAKDGKNIAILLNKDHQYFLKGVYRWDSIYLHKRVKVTGTLYVAKYDTSKSKITRQTYGMDMYYLLKPKWKLIK